MPYLNTPDLFDAPYASGSDTSREAALRAAAYIGPQGARVWAYVLACGDHGATQKEIAAALGLGRPSVCARVAALEQRGDLVKVDGWRRAGCAVYRCVQCRATQT